jgi:hypothetical protein
VIEIGVHPRELTSHSSLMITSVSANGLAVEQMSEENADLVRRAFQAFNDRDFAALASTCSEDVVMRHIGEAVAGASSSLGAPQMARREPPSTGIIAPVM